LTSAHLQGPAEPEHSLNLAGVSRQVVLVLLPVDYFLVSRVANFIEINRLGLGVLLVSLLIGLGLAVVTIDVLSALGVIV